MDRVSCPIRRTDEPPCLSAGILSFSTDVASLSTDLASLSTVQLYYFLAIVLSLGYGAAPASHQSFSHALLLSCLTVLMWWVICFLAVRIVADSINQGEISTELGFGWFDKQLVTFRWFSLGLIFLCIAGYGFGRTAMPLARLDESTLANAVLLMLPMLGMVAGVWAKDHWFAVRMGYAKAGLRSFLHSMWVSMRSTIGWILLPIGLLLACVDFIDFVAAPLGVPAWLIWTTTLAAALFGMPTLIRRVFPLHPLEPQLARWTGEIVVAAGLPNCNVMLWDTGGRIYNAMIAGVFGKRRIMMLSDRLLNDLTRPELSMVILHEAAHSRRRHVPLRLLALVPAWLLGFATQQLIDDLGGTSGLGLWDEMLGILVGIVATVTILRIVSFYSEYDADRTACRIAPKVASQVRRNLDQASVPETSELAGRTLASALQKVAGSDEQTQRSSWLHPAICDRITALTGIPAGFTNPLNG